MLAQDLYVRLVALTMSGAFWGTPIRQVWGLLKILYLVENIIRHKHTMLFYFKGEKNVYQIAIWKNW
jgi:hypothetical protein